MTEERRRRERVHTSEQQLADAFAYANMLAGLPPDDFVERTLIVGDGRSTWSWTEGRTYRVHQYLDGTTSVEVTLA